MSFNRPLTGQSQIYATVALNTNVCANSVSTVYLSATNASFINLTTNTWTTGNVSTPNVIATNGYFSTLTINTLDLTNISLNGISVNYVSSVSVSAVSANICTIQTAGIISSSYVSAFVVTGLAAVQGSGMYCSNLFTEWQINTCWFEGYRIYVSKFYSSQINSNSASITNISVANLQLTSTVNIPTANLSTANISLENTLTSNISNLYVSNISSLNTSITYVSYTSATGAVLSSTSIYTSDMYTSILNSSTFSASNVSLTNLSVSTKATITSCSVSALSASKITLGYSSTLSYGSIELLANRLTIKGDYQYAPTIMITPTTSQAFEIGAAGTSCYVSFYTSRFFCSTIATSSISCSYISVKNMSLENISGSTDLVIRNNGVILKDYLGGGTTYLGLNYDDAILGNTPGLIFEVDSSGVNIDIEPTLPLVFTQVGVSQLVNTSVDGWTFYRPINTSNQINASNISAKNISTSGLTSTSCNISTMSTAGITSSSYVSAYYVTGLTSVQGSGMYCSNLFTDVQINTSQVSSKMISNVSLYTSYASCLNASAGNFSYTTATGTTLRATNFSSSTINSSTINVCTLNASTFSLTNVSLTNLSVSSTATIVTCSTSDLSTSKLVFNYTNSSSFGSIERVGNRFTIKGDYQYASTVMITPNGVNNAFEFGPGNVSCYVSFYTSKAFVSTLSVCTFNPTAITTSTISASYISVTNMSLNNISGSTDLTIRNNGVILKDYVSGGTTYLGLNYDDAILGNVPGLIFEVNSSLVNIDIEPTLPLAFTMLGVSQLVNTSVDGWTFYSDITTSNRINVSNISVSNISVETLSAYQQYIDYFEAYSVVATQLSTTGSFSAQNVYTNNGITIRDTSYHQFASIIPNTSTLLTSCESPYLTDMRYNISGIECFTITPTYSSFNSSLYCDSLDTQKINVSTINNSINCSSTTGPLLIYANSPGTQTTGIRVPNYLDGVNLGTGLTIGLNQTTGFINVCRALRVWGGIATNGAFNMITATDNLGIGTGTTTGQVRLGNTAMTGNISLATGGGIQIGSSTTQNISFTTVSSVNFNSDIRSTYNTSGLLPSSTQLGSNYFQTTAASVNKTTTGQTFLFCPLSANVSLTTVPVGLYLVSAQARIKTVGGYNASITGFNIGTCYGNTYNFTSATTTRLAYANTGICNTSGTTNEQFMISFTGLVNMSATGNYVGAFMSATANAASTVGSIDLFIDYCTVVKIA